MSILFIIVKRQKRSSAGEADSLSICSAVICSVDSQNSPAGKECVCVCVFTADLNEGSGF